MSLTRVSCAHPHRVIRGKKIINAIKTRNYIKKAGRAVAVVHIMQYCIDFI